MNRTAQAVVLFLIGGAVLRAGFTDLYLRYVKAGLRPLLLAAGFVLIAAALATVWYEIRGSRSARRPDPVAENAARQGHETDRGPGQGHGQGHVHTHGHGEPHREPRVSWLLVLPFFALILVAPPAPGSYSAMRAGTALQPTWEFARLPADDPLRLDLVDYASRAAYDHGRALDDRRIKITGFVALDRGGTPYLTRMVLNCCAADARPVKIGLTGHTPTTALPPDSWIEVTGAYTGKKKKDPVNDGVIPYIKVDKVRQVPAPRDPYGN
ncbi:TIGR03943 family putative permease subunit [Streptomyces marispadix]|uniref:TIGR03943 family protein n=1 Tax=Streptomyces marispadix TaxID=2922868 RepID=A0ABS9SZV4_9ACTN|nr:TIGR03943 family protein [Streptomyces marispadix]MCH6161708.1 TIGR03943 family protein [Streptomyces marispadix]